MSTDTSIPQPSVRRIVTGINAEGRSYFEQDGASPAERTLPERPGYRMTNLWRTEANPSVNAPDTIAAHQGVLPPKGGSVMRIIEWPAESFSSEESRRLTAATFARLYPDAHRDGDREAKPGQHPGMHKTNTVDYAIVLEGEVTALMDEGETVMRAGDFLIQRGTHHAWANRSGKPAKIAFILIDASAD
jgi:mannose-6-phosphate isomerase-like protein (cupin superfamily)